MQKAGEPDLVGHCYRTWDACIHDLVAQVVGNVVILLPVIYNIEEGFKKKEIVVWLKIMPPRACHYPRRLA